MTNSIAIPATPSPDEHRSLDPGPEAFFDADDPFVLFASWFARASADEPRDPNAVQLATTDAEGWPNVRTVLVKSAGPEGFVVYTHRDSAKGVEMETTGRAALCFYWKSVHLQVRVRGTVEGVADAEADAYFATRARESRLGAWASLQSRAMETSDALEKALAEATKRFEGQDVPRPPNWTGFRIAPLELEFWRERGFRLHDRLAFRRSAIGAKWSKTRLYP